MDDLLTLPHDVGAKTTMSAARDNDSYPIPHKGMGSCSSLVSSTLLLLSHPPEGDGILFFPGFMYTIVILLLPVVVTHG